jgi:hypothetical protein
LISRSRNQIQSSHFGSLACAHRDLLAPMHAIPSMPPRKNDDDEMYRTEVASGLKQSFGFQQGPMNLSHRKKTRQLHMTCLSASHLNWTLAPIVGRLEVLEFTWLLCFFDKISSGGASQIEGHHFQRT